MILRYVNYQMSEEDIEIFRLEISSQSLPLGIEM